MKITDLLPNEQYKLTRQLMDQEEVQWLGRPEPFSLLSKDYKGSLILRWVIVTVVLAAMIIAYTVWAIQTGASYSTMLVVILVLACIYIFVIIPYMDRFSLMKRTFFCVTNKRVMVFVSDRTPTLLNRAGLKHNLISAENGCAHIAFGTATSIKPHRLRVSTITPPTDDTAKNAVGAVFYNIKNAEELTNLLSGV